MALITCYECSKEISDSASACPHCGAPKQHDYTPVFKDDERQVSLALFLGILIIPIIFVWVLFKKGFSSTSRVWGVCYLLFCFWLVGYHPWAVPDVTTRQESDFSSTATNESTSNRDPDGSERPDAYTLHEFSAQQIADAYKANTVAADNQFKGKWFIISGDITGINTDFMNDAYVTLKVDDKFDEPQVKFEESEKTKLASLNIGDQIKAVCIGDGDAVKTPMLTNCTLEK